MDESLYQEDFNFGETARSILPWKSALLTRFGEMLKSISGGAPVHWATSTFDGLYLIDGVKGLIKTICLLKLAIRWVLKSALLYCNTDVPEAINIIPLVAQDIWFNGRFDCGQAGVAPDITFVLGSGSHYTIPSSMYVVHLPF